MKSEKKMKRKMVSKKEMRYDADEISPRAMNMDLLNMDDDFAD